MFPSHARPDVCATGGPRTELGATTARRHVRVGERTKNKLVARHHVALAQLAGRE